MPATGFLLGTMRTMAAAGLVLLAGFRLVAYASDVGADPEAAEPNHAQEVGSELAEFRAASLPSGETYVSMQRVALEPGAEVAEPPIDGPRLVSVVSGAVTVRAELAGALARDTDLPDAEPVAVLPRVAHIVEAGETAMIPADVPVVLSNAEQTEAEWIQVQLETPPTVCPCHAGGSGVRRTLLASETLDGALPPGARLVLAEARLGPGKALPLPTGASLQLAGSVAGTGVERRHDGTTANTGNEPIAIVVFTVTPDAVPAS